MFILSLMEFQPNKNLKNYKLTPLERHCMLCWCWCNRESSLEKICILYFHCVLCVISYKIISRDSTNQGGGLLQKSLFQAFSQKFQGQTLFPHEGLTMPQWTPSYDICNLWPQKLNIQFKSWPQQYCLDKALSDIFILLLFMPFLKMFIPHLRKGGSDNEDPVKHLRWTFFADKKVVDYFLKKLHDICLTGF